MHDTFHHQLAGEPDIFPDLTGLVHIAGVDDLSVSVAGMRDSHRVLVDAGDRLGNINQINALISAGYEGRFSIEPISDAADRLTDLESPLRESKRFIRARTADFAA